MLSHRSYLLIGSGYDWKKHQVSYGFSLLVCQYDNGLRAMKNHWYILTIILACSVGVLQSGVLSLNPQEGEDHSDQSTPIGGPFSLSDHTGQTRSDRDFLGKYVLLYFGYTFCPDVCPTALLSIASSLNEIEKTHPEKSDQLQPLFITLDPERDTQDTLAQYVDFFHPNLIGLTGTKAQIDDVAKQYLIYYDRQVASAKNEYFIDHSSVIYLLSRTGQYIQHFTHDTTQKEMVQTLIELPAEGTDKATGSDNIAQSNLSTY